MPSAARARITTESIRILGGYLCTEAGQVKTDKAGYIHARPQQE
jgi:hypothetical protein